jgi:hypothetical protein
MKYAERMCKERSVVYMLPLEISSVKRDLFSGCVFAESQ